MHAIRLIKPGKIVAGRFLTEVAPRRGRVCRSRSTRRDVAGRLGGCEAEMFAGGV
jgi:hypothetical protein